MLEVPKDSIYFWMYQQGLRHIDIHEIENACSIAGKDIRPKDRQNYWNGFHNSDLYHGLGNEDIFMLHRRTKPTWPQKDFLEQAYWQYENHPYTGLPEVSNRWVPCNKENKPMIKWSKGCMELSDALAFKDQVFVAENLKGTQMIVIDCDGDHDKELDTETMSFLYHYYSLTHCLVKPYDTAIPASFHLTFSVNKIIPTMHFPFAHIDIVGNRRNSLRYWKNKEWNGLQPAPMTDEIWKELQRYIKYRKEKA